MNILDIRTGSARKIGSSHYRGTLTAGTTRLWECLHQHEQQGEAFECARLAREIVRNVGKCPVFKAYRTMADMGRREICGNPIKTAAGYCLRHDPELKPKRDANGQILSRRER